MIITRRRLLAAGGGLLTAPAIIRPARANLLAAPITGGGGGGGPFIAGTSMVGNASAVTTTAGINTAGANLFVVVVSAFNGGGGNVVTDSKGNTPYIQLNGAQVAGGSSTVDLWYFYSATAGAGAGHTFTNTAAGTAYAVVSACAFSMAIASPLDQNDVNFTGSSVTSITAGATGVTPGFANEIITSGIVVDSSTATALLIDSGFTAFTHNGSSGVSQTGGMAYLVQTGAAFVNPTWSWAGANAVATNIATFKT